MKEIWSQPLLLLESPALALGLRLGHLSYLWILSNTVPGTLTS